MFMLMIFKDYIVPYSSATFFLGGNMAMIPAGMPGERSGHGVGWRRLASPMHTLVMYDPFILCHLIHMYIQYINICTLIKIYIYIHIYIYICAIICVYIYIYVYYKYCIYIYINITKLHIHIYYIYIYVCVCVFWCHPMPSIRIQDWMSISIFRGDAPLLPSPPPAWRELQKRSELMRVRTRGFESARDGNLWKIHGIWMGYLRNINRNGSFNT